MDVAHDSISIIITEAFRSKSFIMVVPIHDLANAATVHGILRLPELDGAYSPEFLYFGRSCRRSQTRFENKSTSLDHHQGIL
jgi:hypothetical protein